MSSIADEKYVCLTTFTRDGRRKPVPVWIADLGDGRVGFTTGHDAWKVKRIRHTPAVELVAADMRGRPRTAAEPATGSAVVVTGAEFDVVMAAIRKKYGFQVPMMQALEKVGKLFGRGGDAPNCGVVITLD